MTEARLQPLVKRLRRFFPTRRTTTNHIAIGGVSYCGSTLLSTVFGSLPEVGNIGESHWLVERRVDGRTVTADLAGEDYALQVHCRECGPDCEVLSQAFRTALQEDPSDWYKKIRERLGRRYLVSSDKNLSKLKRYDPKLDLDLLVLFRAPERTLRSHLNKIEQADNITAGTQEVVAYLDLWTRSYQKLIDCPNRGTKLFLSFESFCADPDEHLRRFCDIFAMPFDPKAALEIARDQHYLGGNRRVARMLRQGSALRIDSMGVPGFTDEQWAAIETHAPSRKLYLQLLKRHETIFPGGIDAGRQRKGVSPPRLEVDRSRFAVFDQHLDELAAERGFSASKQRAKRQVFQRIAETQQAQIEARIAQLDRTGGDLPLARFFTHLLNDLDFERFEALQRRILTAENPRPYFGALKYLDLDHYMTRAFRTARKLGLADGRRRTVLDLGSGPCHFGYVCRYLGHEVLGTDLPTGAEGPGHNPAILDLYRGLAEIFGVKRQLFRIQAYQPLPDLERRFDLVIGHLVCFDCLEDGRRWGVKPWRFFLQDMVARIAALDGQLYLKVNGLEGSDQVLRLFADLGAAIDQRYAAAFFEDLSICRQALTMRPPEPSKAGSLIET